MGTKSAIILSVILYVCACTISTTTAVDVSEVDDDDFENEMGVVNDAGEDTYGKVKSSVKAAAKDAKPPVQRPPTFLARTFKPWIAAYKEVAEYVKNLIGDPVTTNEL